MLDGQAVAPETNAWHPPLKGCHYTGLAASGKLERFQRQIRCIIAPSPMKRTCKSPLPLLFALLLLVSALPAQAGVSASISSPTTGMEQPFRLTLEMEGEQQDAPDLSVLDADFEILSRATQQSVTIINGKMSSRRSLVLTLLPKRTGRLTIPPIAFGDQKTKALTLEVTEQAANGAASDQQARVELSLNKAKAYPQEEVLLTLKLYLADGVRGEQLDEPKPSLGDTRLTLLNENNYRTEQDGVPYRVLERTYSLFAYQAGSLKIEPVGFRGHSGGGSVFGLLDDPFRGNPQDNRVIRTRSNAVSLEIKPIPAAFSGAHWLPARNLQLADAGLDGSQPITAGNPVTRRIMLVADGLMSSQLPAIDQPVPDGIKSYEERPQLKDTPGRTGISGSRQSVITLIATQPGSYTLPAVEIPWWNTELDRQAVARLPAVTLRVLPGQTASGPTGSQTRTAPSAAAGDDGSRAGMQERPMAQPDSDEGGVPHWLVWMLATAWLATLFAWWFSRRGKAARPPQSGTQPPAPTAPEPGPADEIVEGLKQAYGRADAAAAREWWLKWGQRQWPENPPHNLTRLAGRCPPALAQAVIALERAIYSPGGETGWAEFDPASLEERAEGKMPSKQGGTSAKLQPLNP